MKETDPTPGQQRHIQKLGEAEEKAIQREMTQREIAQRAEAISKTLLDRVHGVVKEQKEEKEE